MQSNVPSISFFQGETLILFTAHWSMPRNFTIHTDKSLTKWAFNTAVIWLTWWTCPSWQTLSRINQSRTIWKWTVDSLWTENICLCKGSLQRFKASNRKKRSTFRNRDEILTSQLRTSNRDLWGLYFSINIGFHAVGTKFVRTFHFDHHWWRFVLATYRTVFQWYIPIGRWRNYTNCHPG